MKKHIAIYLLTFFTFIGINVSHAEDFDLRNTYAVVWEIETNDKELYKFTIAEQSNKVIELWQQGVIENVYLDPKTAQEADKASVVFFIKAKTEKEAKGVLDNLPFVKKKLAKYELHHVGVLWLKQF